jgi:hypothetical protein
MAKLLVVGLTVALKVVATRDPTKLAADFAKDVGVLLTSMAWKADLPAAHECACRVRAGVRRWWRTAHSLPPRCSWGPTAWPRCGDRADAWPDGPLSRVLRAHSRCFEHFAAAYRRVACPIAPALAVSLSLSLPYQQLAPRDPSHPHRCLTCPRGLALSPPSHQVMGLGEIDAFETAALQAMLPQLKSEIQKVRRRDS